MFSFLNQDFYKFTMCQTILHHFSNTEVEYKFVCRNENVNLLPLKDKIEEKIDFLCETKITKEDLNYLRTIRFLKNDFLDFLEDFTFKRRFVKVYEENNKLQISIKGQWCQTIFFEIPILAMVSELYCQTQISKEEAFKIGSEKLYEKIDFYNKLENPFIFADFGTRRSYSQSWHENVVKILKEKIPNNFIGSSNVDLCRRYSLVPIGTMAHEYIMGGMGLNHTPLANSQKYMLEKWIEEFRGDLGIALTDSINMDAFLNDFDLFLAKLYDGCRQDSGDPFIWGDKLIAHYKKLKIDPMTKTAVFSDNLNFQKAAEINDYFKDRVKVSFGIGTNISNDVGVKPLSIVIKMTECNGNPVAKLSDSPGKTMCKDEEFIKYLKKVFKVGE